MWGFQLWVNLPARDKMTAPRYQDIPPARIPEVTLGEGVRVRVIAGEAGGARGPVEGIATRPLYLDVRMPPGARFDAAGRGRTQRFAYVYEGRARLGPGDDDAASPARPGSSRCWATASG